MKLSQLELNHQKDKSKDIKTFHVKIGRMFSILFDFVIWSLRTYGTYIPNQKFESIRMSVREDNLPWAILSNYFSQKFEKKKNNGLKEW